MTEKLGRDGRVAKTGYLKSDPIHDGMKAAQVSTAGLGGLGHPYAGAPDGSSANPLAPTVPGKSFVGKSVPTTPGMRSRTNPAGNHAELGELLLDQAHRVSAPDDRWAHGRDLTTGRKL